MSAQCIFQDFEFEGCPWILGGQYLSDNQITFVSIYIHAAVLTNLHKLNRLIVTCTILITVSGGFIEKAGGGEYSEQIFLNTMHTAVAALFRQGCRCLLAENNMHPIGV